MLVKTTILVGFIGLKWAWDNTELWFNYIFKIMHDIFAFDEKVVLWLKTTILVCRVWGLLNMLKYNQLISLTKASADTKNSFSQDYGNFAFKFAIILTENFYSSVSGPVCWVSCWTTWK